MRTFSLLLLLPLLPLDDWSKIESDFKAAIRGASEEAFDKAVDDVARDDSERAARLLLAGLACPTPHYYWSVIHGLSRLTRTEAVDPVAEAIVGKRLPADQRRDLMMALLLNRTASGDLALLRVAKDGDPQVQVTAVDELAGRASRDAIPVFINLLKSAPPELKRRAHKGLIAITGLDLGAQASSWQAWWDSNKATWKPPSTETPSEGPGRTVTEVIRGGRKTEVEDLAKLAKTAIIVVSGIYDEVQDVLTHLKVPHTVIKPDALATQDLSKTLVLLINCGTEHPAEAEIEAMDPSACSLPKPVIEKIRDFTARGGYVFTSDWGLHEILEPVFPGYCKVASMGGGVTVDIYPKKGSTGHPLLREVFVRTKLEGGEGQTSTLSEESIRFKWVIDGGSDIIDYDPAKVTCLVEAPDFADAEGKRKHPAIAVTFAYGGKPRDPRWVATGGGYEDLAKASGGRVLHVLSHFRAQATQGGDYAIQNMLLNFILEAKAREGMRKK